MEIVAVSVEKRSSMGKAASRDQRREGLIPCVLYGGESNVHFTVSPLQVKALIYTPQFKLAEIQLDGESVQCIVKDVQFHPVTDRIVHIDFLRLVPGRKIKVDVPVKFEGVAPGLKAGGKLMQKMRRVSIKTTPESLVDSVLLDVSELELGQSIRVRDIKKVEGVEIMNALGTPVASVEIPRALRSAEAAEEEEGVVEGEEGAPAEGSEGGEATE